MNEIFRFLQVRPTQKISKEEKKLVGLSLYPNNSISDFLASLKDVKCDKDKYAKLIKGFIDAGKAGGYIKDLKEVHPVILEMYHWLDYKAKPIRVSHFEKFIQFEYLDKIKKQKDFSLEEEWKKYADNYLVRVYNGDASLNSEIDFQLLIKVCYILDQLKTILYYLKSDVKDRKEIFSNGKLFKIPCYSGGGAIDFINYILNLPLLLPADIFDIRCCKTGRIELPNPAVKDGECECNCEEKCQSPSKHCICIKPYVADLLIVKEELARYEEGDIASIENTLAGEEKVRKHRSLFVTETIRESESEVISSEERDHQVSEQFSLQNQVNKTVQASLSVDAGVTATSKFGPNTSITAHANIAGNYSKAKSESSAKSYARDVVERSVTKLQESVRKFESSRVINELEEKNRHSINNKKGGNRAGIYYWVNKITNAQVFNHGKHMMFDVYLPEPAALYKKLFKLKNEKQKEVPAVAPTKPDITLADINRNDYDQLLQQYGVTGAEAPPENKIALQISFEHHIDEDSGKKVLGFSKKIQSEKVPEGYAATSVEYDIRCETGHPKGTGPKDEAAVIVNIGESNIFLKKINEYVSSGQSNQSWNSGGAVNLDDVEGVVSLSVAGFGTLGIALAGAVTIKCSLKDEALENWKLKIYNLIMDDYNRKLGAFEAQQSADEELIQIKGRNPFLNREIERNELKRHIIAILMCNYFNGIGSMMDKVEDCGFPEINFEKLEKDAPVIQFFEQVFEWKYVTYLFYHSMWARKCKWVELFEEDSGDPLFDKFLTSGAARVQVPVREGMEDIFNWFLRTGQIWGASGVPPVYGDDEYVSMIQEIKEARQGDYSERDGDIKATTDPKVVQLTNSLYYWDIINGVEHKLNLDNDIDREILIDLEIYRIVDISQDNPSDNSTWNITLDRRFEGDATSIFKHSVGAVFVGAPWEVVIPTKLVYLRNENDKLPEYPLT